MGQLSLSNSIAAPSKWSDQGVTVNKLTNFSDPLGRIKTIGKVTTAINVEMSKKFLVVLYVL